MGNEEEDYLKKTEISSLAFDLIKVQVCLAAMEDGIDDYLLCYSRRLLAKSISILNEEYETR